MQKNDHTLKQACFGARFVFLAFGMGISSLAPLIPFIKTRHGLDEAQLGLLLLVFGIGALSTMPISGWLIQRFGNRLMTLISGLMVAITLPLLILPESTVLLAVILFIFGATTGAMNVSVNAQAVTIESTYDVPLMSGFHCVFSLGGLFGALSSMLFLKLDADFLTSTLITSSIIALLVLSQWKKLLPDIEHAENEAQDKPRSFIPEKKVLFLGILCFIAFTAEGSMLDWSAEFLHSSLSYSESAVGIGYALFSIAMAFGRLVGNRMIKRFGIYTIFQMGSFMAATGFLLLVTVHVGYCELLGFMLIGLGASNLVPILFSFSGKLPNTPASYALTLVTTCGYGGILIGPIFVGFLAYATSLSVSFVVIAFFLIGVGIAGNSVLRPTPVLLKC